MSNAGSVAVGTLGKVSGFLGVCFVCLCFVSVLFSDGFLL